MSLNEQIDIATNQVEKRLHDGERIQFPADEILNILFKIIRQPELFIESNQEVDGKQSKRQAA